MNKRDAFKTQARVLKALANESRLLIVDRLNRGECSVGELTELVGSDVSTVSKHLALLRGHGNVVVGGSIREAVFRAVYTEVNAKLAAEALRLGDGEVSFLNEGEAAASTATNQAQSGRAWDLWKAKVLDPGG